MNEIDVAVIGGGVVGLACALELAESGAIRVCHRAGIAARTRHEHAQQRRDSRRHLLSARFAQGQALPRGARSALRVLRAALRPPSALRETARRVTRERDCRARGVAGARHRERRDIARNGRRGFRAAEGASCARRRRGLVAGYGHRRSRSAHYRARHGSAATSTSRCSSAPPSWTRRPANGGVELVTPHERFRAQHRRQCRRVVCRRRLGDARRKTISHQAVPRRVRRACRIEARLGERPGVSSSARRWIRLGRASHSHDMGQRAHRPDRQVSGFEGRLRGRAPAARRVSRADARVAAGRSPSPTCSRAAPAFARNCTAPTRNSQTSSSSGTSRIHMSFRSPGSSRPASRRAWRLGVWWPGFGPWMVASGFAVSPQSRNGATFF